MTDTGAITKAKAAYTAALDKDKTIRDEMQCRISAVHNQFQPALDEVNKEKEQAWRALQQAIADEGLRQNAEMPTCVLVEWEHPIKRGFEFTKRRDHSKWVLTGRRGRYEVRTPESRLQGYDQPSMGARFIRILKKDGTPGVKHVPSSTAELWLPEGQELT